MALLPHAEPSSQVSTLDSLQNNQLISRSANGFKNFFPSVVRTLGFSPVITLVLTCPPYLLAGIFTIVVSLTSGKYNERTWHITVCKAIAILGFALAPATLNTATRYVAMCKSTQLLYGLHLTLIRHLHDRNLRCQLDHPRMGRYRLLPDRGEESRHDRHDHITVQRVVHLHPIPVQGQ